MHTKQRLHLQKEIFIFQMKKKKKIDEANKFFFFILFRQMFITINI